MLDEKLIVVWDLITTGVQVNLILFRTIKNEKVELFQQYVFSERVSDRANQIALDGTILTSELR